MVTVPGVGWWEASDGKWYPPELHPGYATSPPSTVPVRPPEADVPGFGAAITGPWFRTAADPTNAVSLDRNLERPEIVDRARGLVAAKLRTSVICLVASGVAIVVGIGIALVLGLSHPAGQPTPSSIWQSIAIALFFSGGFGAIGSGYRVWMQRRSLAAMAQPAQPFSMTTFTVTSYGKSGSGMARYAVLFPPQGFGGQPLAVVQLVSGSAPFSELPPGAIVAVHGDVSRPGTATMVNPGDGHSAEGLVKSKSSGRWLLSQGRGR